MDIHLHIHTCYRCSTLSPSRGSASASNSKVGNTTVTDCNVTVCTRSTLLQYYIYIMYTHARTHTHTHTHTLCTETVCNRGTSDAEVDTSLTPVCLQAQLRTGLALMLSCWNAGVAQVICIYICIEITLYLYLYMYIYM